MRPVYFRRMPLVLHLWARFVRRTPNIWVTTPIGVCVPRALWATGAWSGEAFRWVRVHEEAHWRRLNARPYLSRWGWVLRYQTSKRMAYEEEIHGMREELKIWPPWDRVNHAEWLADALINDYGMPHDRETILRDLLTGI